MIDRGRKNQQLLIQPQYKPWAVEEEVAVIFCGVNGLLEDVPLDKVHEFEEMFLQLLRAKYQKEVLDELKKGVLSDEVTALLTKVASEIASKYKA